MALLGFARYTHFNKPVNGLELNIEFPDDGGFLSQVEMYNRISNLVGINERRSLRTININKIKSEIASNPYVHHVEAFTSIEGQVKVKLYEREPFLRFFTKDYQSFYLDRDGMILPLHSEHTKRVLVANGNIQPIKMPLNNILSVNDPSIVKTQIKSIFSTATIIEENELLRVLIDQIYINDNNEIELTPRIGDAYILLGDSTDLRDKLENVSIFYKAKATTSDLQNYVMINARFMNQIVCTKRDTL